MKNYKNKPNASKSKKKNPKSKIFTNLLGVVAIIIYLACLLVLLTGLNYSLFIPFHYTSYANAAFFAENTFLTHLLSFQVDAGFVNYVLLGGLVLPLVIVGGMHAIGNALVFIRECKFVKSKKVYDVIVGILLLVYIILEIISIINYIWNIDTATDWIADIFTSLLFVLLVAGITVHVLFAYFAKLVEVYYWKEEDEKRESEHFGSAVAFTVLLSLSIFIINLLDYIGLEWIANLLRLIVVIGVPILTIVIVRGLFDDPNAPVESNYSTISQPISTYKSSPTYSSSKYDYDDDEEEVKYMYDDGSGCKSELKQDVGNPNIWYDSRGNKVTIDPITGHWEEL
ncbi:MAG: hypothetical protein IKD43_00515 [Clostridia bacterium]|nr:hypothetical protein [Clostridia bacterium]